jgi:hypothetical protein
VLQALSVSLLGNAVEYRFFIFLGIADGRHASILRGARLRSARCTALRFGEAGFLKGLKPYATVEVPISPQPTRQSDAGTLVQHPCISAGQPSATSV